MTRTHTLSRLALVVALALSLASGPAIGTVTADDHTTGADLIVEQPDYVETDVEEHSSGGTPVYIVNGGKQTLHPQNFNTENVTDYGVTTGEGSLSYNDDLERFEFDSEANTGSFELYWIVEETHTVEDEQVVDDGNETTTETVTTTETETVRYEAVIQVDDLAHVAVIDVDEANQLEEDATEWRDWNETVTEVRESGIIGHAISAPQSNKEVMQSMVNAYLTTRSPTHLLDGGFTSGIIVMTTTLGGIFLFLVLKVPDVLALRKIIGEHLQMKRLRNEEGDVSEKQEQVDLESRLQAFANIDWQDVPSVTDHNAAEARDKVGETPAEGLEKLCWLFHPDTMKENRVRVMGASGYLAQIDRLEFDDGTAADGGQPAIDSARLVKRDVALDPDETVADRDDLVTLTEPSETLLEAIPDDDPELIDFPMETADFDLDDLKEPPETLSLTQLLDELEFDEYGFDDDEHAGTFLVEFMQMVNNHPISNDDGTIDGPRAELEKLLQFFQAADDRYQMPLAKWYKQHFERALKEYDHDDELRSFLNNHRSRMDTADA